MMDFLREGLIKSFTQSKDCIAFVDDESESTYQQLNEWSDSFARHLQASAANERVLLLSSNKRFDVVVFLAAIRAGRTLVLLDAREPTSRIRAIAHDMQSSVVYLSSSHPLASEMRTLRIQDCIATPTGEPKGSTPWHHWGLNDPAWIYFTSGSTGAPKGVEVPYRRRASANFISDSSIAHNSRVVNTRPFSFLAPGTTLLRTLFVGARFRQVDLTAVSTQRVLELIQEENITHITLPPSFLRGAPDSESLLSSHHVSEILITGERCLSADLFDFRKVFPNAVLRNTYGSTELGTIAYHRTLPSDDIPRDPIPVGNPVDCDVYIVDDQGNVQLPGELGSIAVVSQRRASGYLVGVEKQALSQIVLKNGTEAVITGDVGYIDTSGILHVLGRKDDVVKINGQLVNTSAIRAVLVDQALVNDAEVFTFQGKRGRTRLAVIAVPRSESTTTKESIRRVLSQELPSWMVPHRVVFVEAIPRGIRGKTDRMRLLSIAQTSVPILQVQSTMGDPLIWRIRSLIEEFVELDGVRTDTDLRYVGLDSLDCIELIDGFKQQFGVNVPISHLAEKWSLETIRKLIINASYLPTKRVAEVTLGKQSAQLYWLLPGSNLITGMNLAVYLADYSSRFFITKGAESRETPLLSVESIAEDLIDQLVLHMKSGAFALIGFSSASWIVQHMAVLLKQLGLYPSALIMIDPPQLAETAVPHSPPEPRLLMLAREGELSSLPPHQLDTMLLNLQLFGIRNHLPDTYDGSTLVILRDSAKETTPHLTALLPRAEVEYVDAEHLELMRNPCICGPLIDKFLQ